MLLADKSYDDGGWDRRPCDDAPPFNPLHPYIGMVLDVADYIPFQGTSVSVNGLKWGVSDTGGLIVLIRNLGIIATSAQ